jgi:hypothetical protein
VGVTLPSHLTRTQVARLCRVTPSSVYQWALPVEVILGTPMVPVSALIEKGLLVVG